MKKKTTAILTVIAIAVALPTIGYVRSRVVTSRIMADWRQEKIDHGMTYRWTRIGLKNPEDYLPWMHWLVRYENEAGRGETFVYTVLGGEPN